MGKAKIVSGGTDGQYNINLKRDMVNIESTLDWLENRQTEIIDDISDAWGDRDEKYQLHLDQVLIQDELMTQWRERLNGAKVCEEVYTEPCYKCPQDECSACEEEGKWRLGLGPCSYLTQEDCEADEPAELWRYGTGGICTYDSKASCEAANPSWRYGPSGPAVYPTEKACNAAHDPADMEDQIIAQHEVVSTTYKEWQAALAKVAELELEQSSIAANITRLEAVQEDVPKTVWCVDLSEQLFDDGVVPPAEQADVGTIDIPGDQTLTLLRPGYEDAAVYDDARDGIFQKSEGSSPAVHYVNWASKPGWQKWLPGYRTGVIASINDEDQTCTVTLDAAKSSEQGLDLNYQTTLTDVPAEYMTCNMYAFEVGDNVVVEFRAVSPTKPTAAENWHSPVLIGFKDNPKECPVKFGYRVQPNPGCETADAEECWNGWGAPFDDGEEPPALINPPWGTLESGSQIQSLLVQDEGVWKHWRNPETSVFNSTSGTIDWQGNDMLCGWYGGDQGSRYRIHGQSNFVAYEGRAIIVPNAVTGACVREFNGEKYIISVSDTNQATIVNTTHVDGTAQWQTDVTEGTYDLSGYLNTGSFWLFNAAGTEAVQIREKVGTDTEHGLCHYGFPVWRRKMKLTVSLRVGGGGIIVPDLTIVDLGDEMAVRTSGGAGYVYHEAPSGTVAIVDQCTGPNGTLETNHIQGWLDDEWWEDTINDSFSYKFYDFKGNTEVSAEFWNTREMYLKSWAAPTDYQYVPDVECTGGGLGYRQTGEYDNWPDCVRDTHLVGIEGDSTLKCGVRFTGGGGTTIEHIAINQCRGSGNSTGGLDNTHTAVVNTTATALSFAVSYMDMRFGQLISVIEKRILTRINTKTSYDPCEVPSQQEADLYGIDTWTTNLKIDIYANGAIVNTEEREDTEINEYEPSRFYYWNPRLDLYWEIHRKCRGYHGTAVTPDYLYQNRQKDPRPMASAGGSSYCVSYVDRWVKYDEEDPPNEDVPPIRSVINNFPVALGIPGTFPNAAPVTPVEPSS